MQALPVLQPICCGPDVQPLDRDASEQLAARFKALADPTRVAIVNSLSSADEVCVCNLTATFDLSQPTISHHLKILREAGLVEAGRRRLGGSRRDDGLRRRLSRASGEAVRRLGATGSGGAGRRDGAEDPRRDRAPGWRAPYLAG